MGFCGAGETGTGTERKMVKTDKIDWGRKLATKTQIYKEVLREYDALRTRKAAELRERKESLYARFPRLAEIEETLSMVGVSTAKLVCCIRRNGKKQ